MTAEQLSSTYLKCSHCPKEFKYESEKRRHELSHSPQFQCSVCSKKFSFISALRRHEKQHNRIGLVECDKCGGKFRDELLLKRHINYAHNGTFTCLKCSSTFNSEAALQTHLKTHKPRSERPYHCSSNGCNKTFNFPHHLKHHELTHTNVKQYFCNECGKGFIQLHHLKTHIKTHDPEHWLSCNETNCNKTFPTEYAFKRHLFTHKVKDGVRLNSKSKLSKSRRGRFRTVKDANQEIEKDNIQIEAKDISETNRKTNKSENNVSNKQMVKDMEKVTDCKAVLGGCLVDDPNGNDCLCAQITNDVDEPYDLTPISKRCSSQANNLDTNKLDKKQNYGIVYNNCDECECANICKAYTPNAKSATDYSNENTVPNIEYGIDGIVKLRDTFDIDIPEKIIDHKDASNNDNFKPVPYNSCKDVLGKCIVSGNGIISENCLCAKMHFDEMQVLAEEVQDIIPQTNDVDFDRFVIL